MSSVASSVIGSAGAATQAPTTDRIRIPSGTFRMGSDKHYPEEARVHRVTVDNLGRRHPASGLGGLFPMHANQNALRRTTTLISDLTLLLATALVCAVALSKPALAQQTNKPNILVIIDDDIGQTNVSAYTHGLMISHRLQLQAAFQVYGQA
jgi:hypothetical protein